MVINGIDYYVGLYIMGADGFPEYEAHFEDFHALNAFIRENADNPKYTNNQMCYSFVEDIDGEPDAFAMFRAVIEVAREMMAEQKEEDARVDEFSKEIHYHEDGVDYQKKQRHFDDIAYVCPHCLRTVDDCRCALYPWYLAQIDKLLVPIIRELNSKGYKTTGCCAGHPQDEEFKGSGVYIAFAEDYDFDEPFPDGGKYSKSKHTISYIPAEEDYDNLVDFQMNVLQRLEDWAEMLFEINFFDDAEEDED